MLPNRKGNVTEKRKESSLVKRDIDSVGYLDSRKRCFMPSTGMIWLWTI